MAGYIDFFKINVLELHSLSFTLDYFPLIPLTNLVHLVLHLIVQHHHQVAWEHVIWEASQ